jgi:hypothetical protein
MFNPEPPMKSPFPGMDPYLEQHWLDVHSRLIIYACDQLQGGLPADLFARVEERVYLEKDGTEKRSMHPDVRVVEHGRRGRTAVAVKGEIDITEPFVIHLDHEPITETFIEIRDAGSGNRVVTVIEFLSPTNKVRGRGQKLYRKKQRELESAGVSLVEVDLVRAGKRVFSVPTKAIPKNIRTPYQVIVRRGWDWMTAEVYALPLRERLPAFRIPLRETDRDIALNLQALIDQCYVNGRYDTIDYQVDADPPLEGHDAEWADALLRAAGKRR